MTNKSVYGCLKQVPQDRILFLSNPEGSCSVPNTKHYQTISKVILFYVNGDKVNMLE